MTRLVFGRPVHGVDVGARTECSHYDSPLDVVAIRFVCCGQLYPCHACHAAVADHEAELRPVSRFDEPSVLCGACGREMTAREYLACAARCPACNAAFNPGCAAHDSLYFEASRARSDARRSSGGRSSSGNS